MASPQLNPQFNFITNPIAIPHSEKKYLQKLVEDGNQAINLLHIFLYNKDVKGKLVTMDRAIFPKGWTLDCSDFIDMYKKNRAKLHQKVEEYNNECFFPFTKIDDINEVDFKTWAPVNASAFWGEKGASILRVLDLSTASFVFCTSKIFSNHLPYSDPCRLSIAVGASIRSCIQAKQFSLNLVDESIPLFSKYLDIILPVNLTDEEKPYAYSLVNQIMESLTPSVSVPWRKALTKCLQLLIARKQGLSSGSEEVQKILLNRIKEKEDKAQVEKLFDEKTTKIETIDILSKVFKLLCTSITEETLKKYWT